MKIISNVILIYSLCATIRFILIDKYKFVSYERAINIILYLIQICLFIKIMYRFLHINN